MQGDYSEQDWLSFWPLNRGGGRAEKSEQIQLEIRHAIDDLVEDISEKMQEGMDRGRDWTDNTTQGVLQALNSGKDHIRKELESIISRRA